ncbi:hypothetical protein F8S13_02240 [Chloroflexia bacterium SDU3-3]|nr:hypothetical protein F8S13_02240 [Chloroflexia bacterium SDU3-3]
MRRRSEFDPTLFTLLMIGAFLYNALDLCTNLQVMGKIPGARLVQAQVVSKDSSQHSYYLECVTIGGPKREQVKVPTPYTIWQNTQKGAKINIAYGLSGLPEYATPDLDLVSFVVKPVFWVVLTGVYLVWYLLNAIKMLLAFLNRQATTGSEPPPHAQI